MKLFLDENVPGSIAKRFLEEHLGSIYAAWDEAFQGCPDDEIFSFLKSKSHLLVTQDMDFSNELRFPAAVTAGIVIVRAGLSYEDVIVSLRSVLTLPASTLKGARVVIAKDRIRISPKS